MTPYTHSEEIHNMTAPREVVPHVMKLVKPLSILDVGCGTGTWLKAFEEMGVLDYAGMDGDYVKRENLKIAENRFHPIDLGKTWSLNRKFDLVVSLEVAEHLPETSADLFVDALARHGESILFSAAIPGQGGQNHLNEQWPAYWQQKFLKHGFYFHDLIRPLIWNNENVHWWYRQNIFLLKRQNADQRIYDWVHPEALKVQTNIVNEILKGQLGVKESFKILVRAFAHSIKIKRK